MTSPSHNKIISKRGRKFAASAVGLVAFIVRNDERILMLSSPKRPDKWEPPNGAYDGDETILEGVMREIREEAANEIMVRPLGALHAYSYRYDDVLQFMVGIAYLFAYEAGEVHAGDDMVGSQIKWMSVEEAESGNYEIIVPQKQIFLFRRAVELYRLWKDIPSIDLQPTYTANDKNKYGD